jgi:prolyl-tRNA editing enzyme YbaK/EbsC (Cys-tRNA(Pro) deacylase)
LDGKGVSYRVIRLRKRAVTVSDVIDYSLEAIDPSEICKTVIVKAKDGGYFGILLLGRDHIDFKKLREFLGMKARLANPRGIEEVFRSDIGTICPILLEIPILLDERVLDMGRINFGSGKPLYGIEIATKDLEKIINYLVLNIAI